MQRNCEASIFNNSVEVLKVLLINHPKNSRESNYPYVRLSVSHKLSCFLWTFSHLKQAFLFVHEQGTIFGFSSFIALCGLNVLSSVASQVLGFFPVFSAAEPFTFSLPVLSVV